MAIAASMADPLFRKTSLREIKQIIMIPVDTNYKSAYPPIVLHGNPSADTPAML